MVQCTPYGQPALSRVGEKTRIKCDNLIAAAAAKNQLRLRYRPPGEKMDMCNVFPQAASSLKVNMLTYSMEFIWVFSRNFLIHTQLNLNTPLDALLKIAARVLAQKARHVEGKRVHGKPSIVRLKKECCSRVCSKNCLGFAQIKCLL